MISNKRTSNEIATPLKLFDGVQSSSLSQKPFLSNSKLNEMDEIRLQEPPKASTFQNYKYNGIMASESEDDDEVSFDVANHKPVKNGAYTLAPNPLGFFSKETNLNELSLSDEVELKKGNTKIASEDKFDDDSDDESDMEDLDFRMPNGYANQCCNSTYFGNPCTIM